MAATAPKSVTELGTLQSLLRLDDTKPFPQRPRAAPNVLIQKLEHACDLDEADRVALQSLSDTTWQVEADYDLSREGDRPEAVLLVVEGLAYRYKILPDGKRQILGLLLPGDFCDLHVTILAQRDHSIGTFTPCEVASIPRATILDLITTSAQIANAFWWATLVDKGIMREWMTSMGQRSAIKMVAHFFCELLVRMQAIGRATASNYELQMTQNELADAFGITVVHLNRMLRDLRDQDLIRLKRGRVDIPDVARLEAFCGFNRNYLHLNSRETR
ncbi:Crp/Fnr family transcriptional regulator [Methylobacterium sp. E-025]|uniref:Crp/Fnr family transcriptional regulator n=1 Tax=Methylobacterium sp. E-025 TaxID=2836561 RepID=UPI001FB9D88F|nr:Crp/Fnr family transcriptional regulator [Methylobacterium sp. E-025]MCJ2110290.1 Crp/Fnr family transcriptional regulator [Methylobacterium sp. E-025]